MLICACTTTYGGKINLHWLKPLQTNETLSPVPCVLGACYAATKDYWNSIRGFEGLKGYGCEEAYISLKSWMKGGGCYLINTITIGHLFRKEFPYVVGNNESILNKLFIADNLLDQEHRCIIFNSVKTLNYMTYYAYKNQHTDSDIVAFLSALKIGNSFQSFLSVNTNAQLRVEALKNTTASGS